MSRPKSKLTFEVLMGYIAFIAPKNLSARDKLYSVAQFILMQLLGEPWLRSLMKSKNRFVDDKEGHTREAFFQRYVDLVMLAEMLFNFQDADGFDAILSQLQRPNPDIFAVLAELETARAVIFMGAPFKFRAPKKKLGDNYDGEIEFPNGELGCTETKCKIETTKLSAVTVSEALDKSQKQLPPDRPGIIFLRIPQEWLSGSSLRTEKEADWSKLLDRTVSDFLQRNQHIVAVEIFTSPTILNGDVVANYQDGREILNPNHKFDKTKDWSLMTRPGGSRPNGWVSLLEILFNKADL